MICPKEKCTGCFACTNICPKNCISMEEDALGHITPEINMETCIECNLCTKVCPVNHPVDSNTSVEAYAAWAKKENERKTSTSGGLASVISRFFIEYGYIVYGASIVCDETTEQLKVCHKRVSDIGGLDSLKGSKYVHSHTLDNFRKVLKDLANGNKVLYIGTPCQIAGLRSYLRKEYANLYLVDIVCHGVPSQKMLFDEIGCYKGLTRFTFRDIDGFNLTLFNNDEIIAKKSYFESFYYSAFLDALNYRENCYSCPYASPKRVSDLTLGDFWGLGTLSNLEKEEEKGISLVLINTPKGKEIFAEIKNKIQYEKRTVKEGVEGNSQLRNPSIPHKNRKLFISNYLETNSFSQAFSKALQYNSFTNKSKRFILNNKFLLGLIKKIKG